MTNVVVLGTLDTKGTEYEFLVQRLRGHGVEVTVVDAGVLGAPAIAPDVSREQVARAAGADVGALAAAGDRGEAVGTMGRGAAVVVGQLYEQGRLDAIIGMGGTGGTSLVTRAMQELPVGVPKLVVSTVASGDTRPYVGATDITMMYSVVDVAGVNQISARVIANAAAAVAGMACADRPVLRETKPLIGASMFGVTTPSVTVGRERLEELGYEVLVFHQTGTGGQSMEELVKAGFIKGVLDVTTTELCDELVGGVLAAHPQRLEVAGSLGIPQVVSLGALDMVNFGPEDTVPDAFRDRRFYVHNPTVTLMRTTPQESAELGRRVARKLSIASGPTALFIPLRGISMIATEGQPFHDPVADDALFSAIRENIGPNVELHELDLDINDPEFALAMANRLHEMIQGASRDES
jgi:uncharacterized protein (UPF0261 family)